MSHGRTAWTAESEEAHRHAVRAATEGLRDAGLGELRLTGAAVPTLADAAVSSATPFLRAPLLARIGAALGLHVPVPADDGPGADRCAECAQPFPCRTVLALTLLAEPAAVGVPLDG